MKKVIRPLKYQEYSIVFQEVPNEVSLCFNISDCPYKCKGCHSKGLWEYDGDIILNDLERLIIQYKDCITCVCFMGGNQNMAELKACCELSEKYNLKTCLYTGGDMNDTLFNFSLCNLNYIKVGCFIEEFGGLDKITTNQKMYKIDKGRLLDITHVMRKGIKGDK